MLCLPDIARSSLLMWKNGIQIFLFHNHFVINCFVIVRKNKETNKITEWPCYGRICEKINSSSKILSFGICVNQNFISLISF